MVFLEPTKNMDGNHEGWTGEILEEHTPWIHRLGRL